MLTGVDGSSGQVYHEVTLRSELLLLAQGIPLVIPDDINGGLVEIDFEVHWLGLCGDLLGHAEFGPWPECFQSQHPCYDCMWHRNCDCAFLPFNASEGRRKFAHKTGCSGMWQAP